MGIPKVYEPGKQMETHIGDDAAVKSMRDKAAGKAKPRYPDPPLGVGQNNGQAGKMKTRAFTPGGPAGS